VRREEFPDHFLDGKSFAVSRQDGTIDIWDNPPAPPLVDRLRPARALRAAPPARLLALRPVSAEIRTDRGRPILIERIESAPTKATKNGYLRHWLYRLFSHTFKSRSAAPVARNRPGVGLLKLSGIVLLQEILW
jgi:hypothetical protein